MIEDLLSIDKVAKKSGLASSALRYYERFGLISTGIKIAGRRHYEPSVLHRLSVIRTCQMIGFSLAEIAMVLNGRDAAGLAEGSWRELARARRQQVLDQIEQLRDVVDRLDIVLGCSCHELRDCPMMGSPSESACPPGQDCTVVLPPSPSADSAKWPSFKWSSADNGR